MTDISTSTTISTSHLQPGLFRPSLQYPVHPYAAMLSDTARRYPEQTALLFKDVNLTYRELHALVNSFANALLAIGIKAGKRVCLFMTNRPEYVISWFAITMIGAVASPMNPSYKEREVAYQLSNSEAVAVIVQDSLLPLVQAVQVEASSLQYVVTVGTAPQMHSAFSFSQLVQTYPSVPLHDEPKWEDLVALPYSSGTTGQPKGVMLSHKNLVCNAYQSVATARITFQDRMLIFLPLYHIYGIMLMGLASLTGATMVLMERFDSDTCLRNIETHGITLLYTVPQVLSALLNCSQLDEFDLHTVRFIQCGAAPLSPLLAHRFQERTHIPVVTSYGLTEAAPGTHSNPVYDPQLMKAETIGLPIHDTKQKIVDIETGQVELGTGEEGELIVQGPQVMQGYWKAPEATATALRNGWLYTGDVGWRDEQGYVTVTDRKKEMIKYKGFSIAPAQIEALLLEHPAVIDAAVIAKKNDEVGEIPKAFVVLKDGYETQRPDELMAWVNSKLAKYKHIRELEYTESIPKNLSGKILRRVLKEQEQMRTHQ